MKERYYELLEQVNSKETFLRFLNVLAADFQDSQEQEAQSPSSPYGPAANNWENPSLGSFLDAMHSWAMTRSAETGELSVPEEPSWNTFAQMLDAAKVYE